MRNLLQSHFYLFNATITQLTVYCNTLKFGGSKFGVFFFFLFFFFMSGPFGGFIFWRIFDFRKKKSVISNAAVCLMYANSTW